VTFGEQFDWKVVSREESNDHSIRRVQIEVYFGYGCCSVAAIMPVRAEAEDSPAYEFLKRVACGLLELDIQCDFLSAENARNTLNAYLTLLSQKLCGSINRGEAKQLLEIGDALKPKECKELLDLTE
jgi:hypothetical protein